MRTSLAAPESTPPAGNHLWLEIRRGRTRAPRRSVKGRRFLIGAGSNCQLQLGGADIPILHSILLIEPDGAHIDSVVAAPQLLVNGQPQRSADLQDGDVFSIGKFEFLVHVPDPAASQQTAVRCDAPRADPPAQLAELSTSELVAWIEHDQRIVDEFESGRLNGARALLAAARQAGAAQAASAPDTADRPIEPRHETLAAETAQAVVCFAEAAARAGTVLDEQEPAAVSFSQRRAS